MPTLRPGLPARFVTRSTAEPANPRAGTPAAPSAAPTSAPQNSDAYLLHLLTQAPYADGTTGLQGALRGMGLTCASWLALSRAEKVARIQGFNIGISGLAPAPNDILRDSATAFGLYQRYNVAHRGRGGSAPYATTVRYSDDAVNRAIAIIDAACSPSVTGGAGLVLPAGVGALPNAPERTPFLESASYTNGPTLLAVALAFAGGYAVRRYLAR